MNQSRTLVFITVFYTGLGLGKDFDFPPPPPHPPKAAVIACLKLKIGDKCEFSHWGRDVRGECWTPYREEIGLPSACRPYREFAERFE